MWYVMQVYTGMEEEIKELCETYIDRSILTECFIPKAENKYKKHGEWTLVEKVLFPGYIFLITDEIEEIYQRLKGIKKFTKVLKSGNEFIPISKEEQAFIDDHDNEKHVFEMSTGYMVGDVVHITEGAFEGYVGKLRKVDRHNRCAMMEVNILGGMREMWFGLEIVERRDK